jgi:hypothetical protein
MGALFDFPFLYLLVDVAWLTHTITKVSLLNVRTLRDLARICFYETTSAHAFRKIRFFCVRALGD